MDVPGAQRKLPVLMLYTLNPEWGNEDIAEMQQGMQELISALRDEGHAVTEVCLENRNLSGLLSTFTPDDFIVFNLCEEIPGTPHSYGPIAQTLEELGFTFTGADSKALSLSEDKKVMKQLLDAHGIATPRWKVYTSTNCSDWTTFPAMVKPAWEHCSVGVSRDSVVSSTSELESRVGYVLNSFQEPALVEEFIDGREFALSMVGNGKLKVLPIVEIDYSAFSEVKDRLCTFEAKFVPGSRAYDLTKTQYPVSLTKKEARQLVEIGKDCFRIIGCRDYARIDCRLREGTFYILDVNVNPDITPGYGLVLSAGYAGVTYGKLASQLVHLASLRHPVFGKLKLEPKRWIQ